jgi:cytochrome o ubiquinol oxidase subunit 3
MSDMVHQSIADKPDKSVIGFWTYLMTDLLLFGTLFATFAVLRNNTAGGPDGAELFSLPYIFVETVLLLTSSFTAGLGVLAARKKDGIKKAFAWLFVTFLLGLAFVVMEITEFVLLAHEGYTWQTSAFLSSYFTLVGTHGLHIIFGLIWLAVLCGYIYKRGLNTIGIKRLQLWALFWHFLDIVWIFIFTVVYLMGALE